MQRRTKHTDRFIPTVSPTRKLYLSSPLDTLLCAAIGIDKPSTILTYRNKLARTERPIQSKPLRCIHPEPVRVLDAPNLQDDFYSSLLSWSIAGELAVALEDQVYIWHSGRSAKLIQECFSEIVSWVAFSKTRQSVLAIARVSGLLQIWDHMLYSPLVQVTVPQGIGALAWKPDSDTLLIGTCSGDLLLYHLNLDLKTFTLSSQILHCHSQQICGVEWSCDGLQYAAGGNDSLVTCFDLASFQAKYSWIHEAAVKALSFSPWQKSLLATGGGSSDKSIRVLHTFTGQLLYKVSVDAQVTSLLWSPCRKELLATYGYALSQKTSRIELFAYPQMNPIWSTSIQTGHRTLGAVESEGLVAVSSSDEMIRFYRIWEGKRKPKVEWTCEIR
ncbi:putative WD repeat-containing protein [Neolecta irregularis DAH-3]|uniref:Putative WD repeat-containing protein n=1 Tax=Neolecta irregularis (strain DAH-3) TaxID=1198029 RepID=A0A1U7LJ18_NEOID|nr:putative WD repeat-containing protein [Neolecta irregularis DAH-3]|eukprot:OLL22639.1 putative WD repeat-containing protein [Neolecta irregularis DAH-3]